MNIRPVIEQQTRLNISKGWQETSFELVKLISLYLKSNAEKTNLDVLDTVYILHT